MTRYLLDTHTLIDWAINPNRLSTEARLAIGSGRSLIFVSAVTAIEIAIKQKLGKLNSPTDIRWLLKENHFEELNVTIEHAEETLHLPLAHKDPFDRLLVAQARIEKLTLITRDSVLLDKYDVATLAV